MMRRFIWILLALCTLLTGCRQRVEYTTVEIKDPVRHYYPILRGQELLIIAKLTNTGNIPLVIEDVQPSCGCIVTDFKGRTMVPPGKFMFVSIRYDSKKNVGQVDHASVSGETSSLTAWPSCVSM